MEVETKDVLSHVVAFFGGLLASLLKIFVPSYSELHAKVREQEKVIDSLREEVSGLEDSLRDEIDSSTRRVHE